MGIKAISHRPMPRRLVVAAIFLFLVNPLQAALFDRGGGLIYDDLLDVTWLQDANYASTQYLDSGFTEGFALGLMDITQVTSWITNLSYFDSVRNVTYADWRLPTTAPINGTSFNEIFSNNGSTDNGFASSAGWVDSSAMPVSEMGHLFYVSLGNTGTCKPNGGGSSKTCVIQAGGGLSNTGPFINTNNGNLGYWTTTSFSPDGARVFRLNAGDQLSNLPTYNLALAVRDGDVGALNAVPIPATVWLFASGLLVVLRLGRRHS